MNDLDSTQVVDVPISRLRPLRERTVSKREYERILASIRAIGLIEPLIVFPDGEDYVILDGRVRHRALLELGVEIVPCILGKQREALMNRLWIAGHETHGNHAATLAGVDASFSCRT